jgi:hypothetical protein
VVVLLALCFIDAKCSNYPPLSQSVLNHRSYTCRKSLFSQLSLRGGKSSEKAKSKKGEIVSKKVAKKKMTKEEKKKVIEWQKGVMQVHGALISITSMYLSRKIMKVDYKNPEVLKKVRIVFVSYLIFAQLLYFVLKFLIKRDNNHTELVTPPPNPATNIPVLGGSSLMKMIDGFGKKKLGVPISVKQYDLQQNKELFTSLITEIIGVTILHFVFKMGAPLLMVPMWGVTNRLKSPLILIRLFGMKPVGQFSRPFKSSMEMMMSDMMSGVTASVGIEKEDEDTLEFGNNSSNINDKSRNEPGNKSAEVSIVEGEDFDDEQVLELEPTEEHQLNDDPEKIRSSLEKEQIASMFADDQFEDATEDIVEDISQQSVSSCPTESTIPSPGEIFDQPHMEKSSISSISLSNTVSSGSLNSSHFLSTNNSTPAETPVVSASNVTKAVQQKRKKAKEEMARKIEESMKSFLDEFDNSFQQPAVQENNSEETKWW